MEAEVVEDARRGPWTIEARLSDMVDVRYGRCKPSLQNGYVMGAVRGPEKAGQRPRGTECATQVPGAPSLPYLYA